MSRTSLTEQPVAKTLFLFCLPVLGSNILQSLNGSVNAIWVGRFLGEAALTATANANMLLFLLLGLVFGISNATSVLVGQAIGQNDELTLKKTIGTGVGFFALLSLVVAVFGYVMAPHILQWMDTPANAMAMAVSYLQVICIALPSLYFYNFVMMALRGSGDSNTPFWFMLASVGLDIVLNPVLIFGWGGLLALGVAGSAWATLISQTLTLIALICWLYRRNDRLCLRRSELCYLLPDPAVFRLLLSKGIPMGLQMLIISSSMLALLTLVNRHGEHTVAAYGAANQLWTYVQMPALAIMVGVSAMTAQNIGAGRWDRVSQITRWGLFFNVLLTGALISLIYLFERQVFGLFLPKGSQALPIALHINHLVAWTFILFGMTVVLLGTMRAAGTVWPPLLILLLSMWVFRFPFAAYAQTALGVDAIWWSFTLGSGLALVLGTLYYLSGRWRRSALLTQPQVAVINDPADHRI